MKKKRFFVEQIVGVLKQVEMGVPVAELIRQVGISEQTLSLGAEGSIERLHVRIVGRLPRGARSRSAPQALNAIRQKRGVPKMLRYQPLEPAILFLQLYRWKKQYKGLETDQVRQIKVTPSEFACQIAFKGDLPCSQSAENSP